METFLIGPSNDEMIGTNIIDNKAYPLNIYHETIYESKIENDDYIVINPNPTSILEKNQTLVTPSEQSEMDLYWLKYEKFNKAEYYDNIQSTIQQNKDANLQVNYDTVKQIKFIPNYSVFEMTQPTTVLMYKDNLIIAFLEDPTNIIITSYNIITKIKIIKLLPIAEDDLLQYKSALLLNDNTLMIKTKYPIFFLDPSTLDIINTLQDSSIFDTIVTYNKINYDVFKYNKNNLTSFLPNGLLFQAHRLYFNLKSWSFAAIDLIAQTLSELSTPFFETDPDGVFPFLLLDGNIINIVFNRTISIHTVVINITDGSQIKTDKIFNYNWINRYPAGVIQISDTEYFFMLNNGTTGALAEGYMLNTLNDEVELFYSFDNDIAIDYMFYLRDGRICIGSNNILYFLNLTTKTITSFDIGMTFQYDIFGWQLLDGKIILFPTNIYEDRDYYIEISASDGNYGPMMDVNTTTSSWSRQAFGG